MSQPTDPRAKRLLKLLFLIQSGRRYNVPRLAETLSVSRRTIYRDVASMKEVGIPVVFDEEHDAFRIVDGPGTELAQIAESELALLLLGAKASIRELPTASEHLDAAVRHLVDGTWGERHVRLSALISHVFVDPPPSPVPTTPSLDVVMKFAEGMSRERRLRLVLDSSRGDAEWRVRFSTHQIRLRASGWMAIGATDVHERACLIDMARVRQADLTDEGYVVPRPSEEIDWNALETM